MKNKPLVIFVLIVISKIHFSDNANEATVKSRFNEKLHTTLFLLFVYICEKKYDNMQS